QVVGQKWRWVVHGFLVDREIGVGQFELQQVAGAGQVQRGRFAGGPFALLEKIGDVFGAESLVLERVGQGAGGGVGPVDFAQGDDAGDVLVVIEATFPELEVIRVA